VIQATADHRHRVKLLRFGALRRFSPVQVLSPQGIHLMLGAFLDIRFIPKQLPQANLKVIQKQGRTSTIQGSQTSSLSEVNTSSLGAITSRAVLAIFNPYSFRSSYHYYLERPNHSFKPLHRTLQCNAFNMKSDYSTEKGARTKKPSLYNRIRANHTLQKIWRVLQFLSATISLGLFSARLAKIIRLVHRATTSNGAVEGILAAAVAYTLISMLLKFVLKQGGPKILRWIWIIFDLLFVGGFIAVAVLTRPNGNGSSGPCHRIRGIRLEPAGTNCNLPWGTFILAIVST